LAGFSPALRVVTVEQVGQVGQRQAVVGQEGAVEGLQDGVLEALAGLGLEGELQQVRAGDGLVSDPGGDLDAPQFGQPATGGDGRDLDALRAIFLPGGLQPGSAGGVTDDDGGGPV
jgi:hypothetical protein